MSQPSLIAFLLRINRWSARNHTLQKRKRPCIHGDWPVEFLERRALLSASAVSGQISQPPVLSGFGGTLSYMKGDNQLPIAPTITVTDTESSNLTGATISFTNWEPGDRLGFFNTAALQFTFSEDLNAHTSVLTLSGTNTLAAYEQDLQSLEFFNVAGNPSTATRVVQIQVTDGIANSNTVSESILFGAPPLLTGFGGTLTYVKGGSPLSFASHIQVLDAESSTLQSATISFSNWQPGDRLDFFNTAALQHSFTEDLVNHTSTLSLTGTGTLAAYQADLQSMMFFSVAGAPVTTPRTVTIQVNDGTVSSSPVSETIDFGQAPILSGFSGTVTYTKGGPDLDFASNIVVSEPGGATLTSATISVVNWQAGDRLSFENSAALQFSFTEDLTAHTAVLTLAGTRSLAAYQTELRSLDFFNVAGAPVTTTRVVSIQVSSDGVTSNTVSENIAFKVGVPTISIAPASITQGTSGTTTMQFTVTLSSASASNVTVAFATSDQTAVAGQDYTATSGTLTIPAGQTTGIINVTILSEAVGESNETFGLTLSNPTNVTLGVATATGTIISQSGSVLSDNLADVSGGTRIADSTHFLAAGFQSGPGFANLQSITLLMSGSVGANVTLALYTGSGSVPATFAGTLTSPSSISTSLSLNTFTTNGLILFPNQKYWVVLQPTSGTVNWSWTNDLTHNGNGFESLWASSSDGGTTWNGFSASPFQMSIIAQ